MSSHIVVVGGTGVVQFSDSFFHMVMNRVEIMPIVDFIGNRNSDNERQTDTKNGNGNHFLH